MNEYVRFLRDIQPARFVYPDGLRCVTIADLSGVHELVMVFSSHFLIRLKQMS